MTNNPTLSKRAAGNVAAVMPKIQAAADARKKLRTDAKKQPQSGDSTTTTSGPPPAIDLATAENWLIRPEVLQHCRDAIDKELLPKHFSYPSGVNGDLDLIDSLCTFFNKYFSPRIPVEPDHLAVTPGCTSSLESLLFNLCDVGDGVLVAGPYWSEFPPFTTPKDSSKLLKLFL